MVLFVHLCESAFSLFYPGTVRSARGTSANENYHRHLMCLLGRGSLSPSLARKRTLHFSYLWNVRMAWAHKDISTSIAGESGWLHMFGVLAHSLLQILL